ncbi:response regulator [Acidobacteria bacterium ACD]|nr:MAG: response regulator [Acidobacteriota bacterium]MDL1949569.1 response regulator [Acidobacteria bacterium ACD]
MNLEKLIETFFAGVPRYTHLATIGRGAMGVVFKARDGELDEDVAIKVLFPSLEVDDPEILARFKREIHLNRKIKHPNVARLHDFGMSGDFPFITMEFIPGRNLRTLIEEEGPMGLDPARAISILRQVCLGTHAAHLAGVIHRDLKSSNVIVDEGGGVAILDFGLARSSEGKGVTLGSTFLGTPHYVSPEQALGKPVDTRTDIYSIGVVAYETLTGTLPFTGDSQLAIAMKHVTQPVPEDLALFPGVTPELYAIVRRAMAKDPADRFPSAAAMEAALAVAQHRPSSGGTRIEPKPVELPPPTVEAAPAEPPVAPAQPAAQARPARRPVVLVVEDEEDHRAEAAEALRSGGCLVREATSGAAALELLHREPPDLILMDTTLPGLDGFDTTRVIKSQPALAQIPVLLTTPKLDRSQYAFGIQSGAADLLNRPYAPAALLTLVWKSLSLAGFEPPPGMPPAPLSESSPSVPKLV